MFTKAAITTIGAGCVLWLLFAPNKPAAARSSASEVGSARTIRHGYPACRSADSLTRIGQIGTDRVAVAKYLAQPGNGCVMLAPGLATIEEVDRDLVKVRPQGDPTAYWTLRTALQ